MKTITHINVKTLAALLLLCVSTAVQAQFLFVTNNGALTITGYTGPGGDVVIPSYTNGLPVTSIADSAFAWCTTITNVVVADTVTNLGPDAFAWCWGLTIVIIGSNVTAIADGVFFNCFRLGVITVNSNNPAYSSLDGVLFNKPRTMLLQYATGRAGSYTVPNTVTFIEDEAFRLSASLTSVTIPDSVITIGTSAFYSCTSLTNLTMGSGVNTIWTEAFAGCTNLTALEIGSSVVNIQGGAFSDCSSLTSLTIPNTVTNIGAGAFAGCTGLTAIVVAAANPRYASLDGILFDTGLTTLMQCPAGKAWQRLHTQHCHHDPGGRPGILYPPHYRQYSQERDQHRLLRIPKLHKPH